MNSVSELPEGYGEVFALNLQKDKKAALIVNGLAVLLMIILLVAGPLFKPFEIVFDIENMGSFVFQAFALFAGVIAYMVLHELVHGIAMKRYGAEKIKYGFTGLYAYAGSECYFAKRPYIVIALAPIVVWGIVLLILNLIVSDGVWFWIIYMIQVVNISGAAGDMYVCFRFSKLPEDILVKDTGFEMTVYSAQKTE